MRTIRWTIVTEPERFAYGYAVGDPDNARHIEKDCRCGADHRQSVATVARKLGIAWASSPATASPAVPTRQPATASARRSGFTEVPASAVDYMVRTVAEETVAAASRDQHVDPPRIRWFANAGEGAKMYGSTIAGSGEIWLRSDLSRAQVLNTAAHEVRHYAQRHNGASQDHEADARRYGDWWETAHWKASYAW